MRLLQAADHPAIRQIRNEILSHVVDGHADQLRLSFHRNHRRLRVQARNISSLTSCVARISRHILHQLLPLSLEFELRLPADFLYKRRSIPSESGLDATFD